MHAVKRIEVAALRRAAAVRPEGWLATVLAAGQVRGRELELTVEAHAALVERYGRLTGNRGWGDRVARVAKPMARVLDAALGTDWQHCGSCQQRQERWNGRPQPETQGKT